MTSIAEYLLPLFQHIKFLSAHDYSFQHMISAHDIKMTLKREFFKLFGGGGEHREYSSAPAFCQDSFSRVVGGWVGRYGGPLRFLSPSSLMFPVFYMYIMRVFGFFARFRVVGSISRAYYSVPSGGAFDRVLWSYHRAAISSEPC